MPRLLSIGQTVIKAGEEYTVSEIDGNVIGLRYLHGGFAMYTTADLVSVQLELDLSPASTLCAASAMRAPAVPLVGGILSGNPGLCRSCRRLGDGFHLGGCSCDGIGPPQGRVVNGRVWRLHVPERRA